MQRRDQTLRLQTQEELDQTPREERPLKAGASGRVIALQRSAGNHSLSARLSRAPDDQPASGTSAEVTLPDIGTIQVLSIQFGRPASGGGTGGSGSGKSEIHEMTFTSRVGAHSPKLARATVDGKPMTVDIVMPTGSSSMQIKLTGAIVGNYTAAGGGSENQTESWSLNFEKLDQSLGPPP